jgi:cyclic-di-GMP phosphodiesterase TipF (flagellum assembly factor)
LLRSRERRKRFSNFFWKRISFRVFNPVAPGELFANATALAGLSAAGFRFALEEVTDLDMDFATLACMGFGFIKLAAPVFLEGLPVPGGRIPASDICRYLADFGLTLIVGRIEDDWLLARILGFGVLFGKGTLFGGPKLVKGDVFTGSAAA